MNRSGGIGTEREGSLHRALKFRYAGEGGSTEVSAGDYVCDGLTGEGELVEVQTGSFGPLKDKAPALTERGPLRIVHPVVVNKRIEVYDPGGTLLRTRKSPRHGKLWDLFKALVYAPELPKLPNLTIELAPVDILERRVDDGTGSWRRKGVRIDDKYPEAFYPPLSLSGPEDYRCFLPFDGGEEFTVRDLAEKARINAALARKTLYVLLKLGLVKRTGKKGNAWIYRQDRPAKTKKRSGKQAAQRRPASRSP